MSKKIKKYTGRERIGIIDNSKADKCKSTYIEISSTIISIVGTVIAGVILKFDFWEKIVHWIENSLFC